MGRAGPALCALPRTCCGPLASPRRLTPRLTPRRHRGAAAKFTKRWCVLDSAYKMHYYRDRAQAAARTSRPEQGSIDLAVAYAASDVRQGLGLEIATPGRTWVFLADNRDDQASWMASFTSMLVGLREVSPQIRCGQLGAASGRGGIPTCVLVAAAPRTRGGRPTQ